MGFEGVRDSWCTRSGRLQRNSMKAGEKLREGGKEKRVQSRMEKTIGNEKERE